MGVITDTETGFPDSDFHELSPSGGCIVTFYRLDCPKCGTITVGEPVIGDPDWNSDETVTCGKPEGEMWLVDLNKRKQRSR